MEILISNSHIDQKKYQNVFKLKNFKIAYNGKCTIWKNANAEKFFLFGKIYDKIKKKNLENPKKSNKIEGSFIILKISKNESLDLWTDKFSKEDIFFITKKSHYIISTSLDNLKIDTQKDGYDKFGISQSLIIYGYRPSKKNTFYKNVKRLGNFEILKIHNKKIKIVRQNLDILNSEKYQKNHINKYFDIFIETLEKNSSKDDNFIYLSSGWDSTSILAGLRYIYGRKKIRCLTIQQNYSEKYGVTNLPEIKKAKKISEFYGVKLDVINLNYLSEEFLTQNLAKIQSLFKSKNLNMFPGLSHFLLAEKASKLRSANDTTVFSGEMSDGAHNLGFSQFTTIFHPRSKTFREYSDKMMSYLFGPTFLANLQNKNFSEDPVWKLLRGKFNQKIEFPYKKSGFENIKKIFLRSFFAQSTRFPMYSLENEIFLSSKGRESYNKYMNLNYLGYYSKRLNNKNHYSIFLNLYNSFHWQGSTIATLKACADYHDLNICNPFHSLIMIEFLEKMPENWGRGLDLNSTKFPLKEMLKEKLNYPFHLQTGPHAYVYDTDFRFNHVEELLLRSKLNSIAKKKLDSSHLISNLDKNHFNIKYIYKIINMYKKNKNLNLKQINDLGSLVANTLIDTY
jgi:hypothetical protein